jgi:hypothetical protein
MAQTVFVPRFSQGKMSLNALQLCDLHHIPDESQVPVARFSICADGIEIDAAVGPGRYKTALLFFFLMSGTAAPSPSFWLTPIMRPYVFDFYDSVPGNDETLPSNDTNIRRVLMKERVLIKLTLKPGYEQYMAAFRTFEEIIEHGWQRRDALEPTGSYPFLRGAIAWAFKEAESPMPDKITISDQLAEKVLGLHKLLNQPAYS